MNSDKKLYKDSSRKKICGVLAEFQTTSMQMLHL